MENVAEDSESVPFEMVRALMADRGSVRSSQ